ncbi:MAG: SLATT domain-containing protein [Rhodocyclaceae bacterium]|nr:MAG: SLATT domain-containing protein [Rhodocyclaceae bacterium]
MTNITSFLEDLRTAAWRTEGARFNAARRLKRRDWFATFSIGTFSAAGIGVTFIQKVYEVTAGTPQDKYLTALSVCLGLFVIVVSLIEWGASGAVKADSLFQNAQKLNAFQRKLGQRLAEVADGKPFSSDEVTALREEYELIKIECAHNHEPVDDRLFLAQRRLDSEFVHLFRRAKPGWFEAKWAWILSLLSVVWYFGFFWLAIGGLIWATPWKGS